MEIEANIKKLDIMFEDISCMTAILEMTDIDKQSFTFYLSKELAKELYGQLDLMFNRDDGK